MNANWENHFCPSMLQFIERLCSVTSIVVPVVLLNSVHLGCGTHMSPKLRIHAVNHYHQVIICLTDIEKLVLV